MTDEQERLKRWALVLGQSSHGDLGVNLAGDDAKMCDALDSLYEQQDEDRKGGLGSSRPHVVRWLGDIRQYFPKTVVQVMQKDALERLNIQRMLLEPEFLETVEPDVHLVASLVSMSRVIPSKTKQSARDVVQKLVKQLEAKLHQPMVRAIKGAINRASRTSRPRANEIDWNKTINKNLKNYLPDRKTIVVEQLVGYGKKRSSLRDIIVCVDQSGSMASSVVYASIFGAVMASISAVRTNFVVFDTEVVDLTPTLKDPVDLLFGTQLGGGTNIDRAVGYCQTLVRNPKKSILVLITDLYEGGDQRSLLRRVADLVASGVTVVCLLALNDEGAPYFDRNLASKFGALGVPSFACTPEQFPALMAASISGGDLQMWAARQDIKVASNPK